jgi:hypothetical protein
MEKRGEYLKIYQVKVDEGEHEANFVKNCRANKTIKFLQSKKCLMPFSWKRILESTMVDLSG